MSDNSEYCWGPPGLKSYSPDCKVPVAIVDIIKGLLDEKALYQIVQYQSPEALA